MNKDNKIPIATIDTLARSIYKQAKDYGFRQIDYVRLVNEILDCTTNPSNNVVNNDMSSDKKQSKRDFINAKKLPVKGDRIKIREFNRDLDLIPIEKWLRDEFGRYFLISHLTSKIFSIDELIDNRKNIIGTIVLNENEKLVGLVAFLNRDDYQKKAELRKLIGVPEMRGKGFGKEATRIWIEYGKQSLGLKKIYLNTLNTNIRNIKLNEELGFKVEGILRNEVLIDNKYHDVLRMGLWKE